MDRNQLSDLATFMVVAQALSFTRAATTLATSPSAVSQTIRRLEAHLGVRLLARTTRSMAVTPAGQRLLDTLNPALSMIDATLEALGEMRDTVAGTIRITSSLHAAQCVLWPTVTRLVEQHPGSQIEICADGALTDIVSAHFDAGVRLGQQVERDMVALRISPDLRMIVVGSPGYLQQRAAPQTPQDLTHHCCINVRLPTSGSLYHWEFCKKGRDVKVRVEGNLIFNSSNLALQAALDGCGLAFVFEDSAQQYLNSGRLVKLLDDWCPSFPGYHLYYPSRRQHTPAFQLLITALRSNAARMGGD